MKSLNTYYHGTSSALPIKKYILPPIMTHNKREHWRTKYNDKVFFTNSILSAYKFARKSCEKFGGVPIVYIVKPIGQRFNTINTEYIADKALIVGVFKNKSNKETNYESK